MRPAKSAAVRTKSCMVFVYESIDLIYDVDAPSDGTTESFAE